MTESMAWATGPLHNALVLALPTFVKEPFSDHPRLDIPRLHKAIGKSHETVYKWLRTSRLNGKNAKLLIDLANSDSNVDALTRLGRTPPTNEQFTEFMMG